MLAAEKALLMVESTETMVVWSAGKLAEMMDKMCRKLQQIHCHK